MIRVTRMNGLEFYVNAEMIEHIEATPDTVVTLSNGRKFVLKDSVKEVVDKVITYRMSIGTRLTCTTVPPSEECIKDGDE